MKLDRHESVSGMGKYALLHLRKARDACSPEVAEAIKLLDNAGLIQWGRVGEDDEFFVMKLKDVNTPSGLQGYAANAALTDVEYAEEVMAMADRAEKHPGRKVPD